jgi:3-oxoadipate enol-lactonase / 4-carboxymuconolactone decarboxylase
MARLVFSTTDGRSLVYDLDGPEAAPCLVLSGSLGTTTEVWDSQMAFLTPWFRVLRIEHPGHGGSSAPAGPYSVEWLGGGVLELLDSLAVGSFSYAGLSLGGLVGMWLAANTERVERLALCCMSPWFGPPEPWRERSASVRAHGTAPLAEAALGRWFTPRFLADRPEVATKFSQTLSSAESVDPEGYAGCCELLSATDLRSALQLIKAPTLVLAGASDPVVPPESAVATMSAISDASLSILGAAAHLANVEQPELFNDAILTHLLGDSRKRGMAVRRSVLGAQHVERALAATSELSSPFQDFLTRWPWGEIWARPGLDRTTRRLVTIAMLVALGRSEELAMHIRAALRDGVTVETLRELLLHSAVYAGVPAANSAFAIADSVLSEEST